MTNDNEARDEEKEVDGGSLEKPKPESGTLDQLREDLVYSEEADPALEDPKDDPEEEAPGEDVEDVEDSDDNVDDSAAEDEPDEDVEEDSDDESAGEEEPEEAEFPEPKDLGLEEDSASESGLKLPEKIAPDVWKKMPKEARREVAEVRKVAEKAIRQVEENRVYTEYSRQTFQAAQSVALEPSTVVEWDRLLLGVHQLNPESVQMLEGLAANVRAKAEAKGVIQPKPAPATEPALDPDMLAQYTIRRYGLSESEADDLKQWVQGQQPRPKAPANTQPVPAQAPVQPRAYAPAPRQAQPSPSTPFEAVKSVDADLAKRVGADYAAVQAKITQRVVPQLMVQDLTPAQAKKLWFTTAQEEVRAHRAAKRKRIKVKQRDGGEELSSRPDNRRGSRRPSDPDDLSRIKGLDDVRREIVLSD